MVSDEELRKKAEKNVEEKIGLYIHISVFLLVNILLYVIWWRTGNGSFPWPIFATIGWGIGVVAHIFVTFGTGMDNSKMVEKAYQRLKGKK